MRTQNNPKPSTAGTPSTEPVAAGEPAVDAKAPRGSRDGLVLLCIAIVSAAIATMLFTQLGLSPKMSAFAGASAWLVFMLIHKQVQKSAQIRHLKVELARARMQGSARPRPASLRNAPVLPPVESARPSDVRRAELIGVPVTSDPSRPGVPRAAGGPPVAADPRSLQSGPVPQSRPSAPEVRAVPPQDRAGGVPLRGAMPPETVAADGPSLDTAAAASIDLTGMRVPPPGRVPSPAVPAGPAPDAKALSDAAPIMPAGEQAADTSDLIRDQWSFRPRSEGQGLPGALPAGSPQHHATTIEGDLELVQRKIRELADEVNAAEASRPTLKPLRAEIRPGPANDALEQSIGALKSAASSMRGRSPVSDFIPTLSMPVAGGARPAETAASPTLPDLVIPASAQSIAGSDKSARAPDVAPAHFDLPGAGLPMLDFPPGPPLGQPSGDALASPAGPSLSIPAASGHSPEIAALARAVEDDAMDVLLAPIVTLSEHSVSHYEMTVVLKSAEGTPLEARENDFRLLGRELDARFDIARLNRAAELTLRMEKREKNGSLLATFLGSSFTNRSFLEALAQAYEARKRLSGQLVVGISQRSLDALSPPAWQAIRDMHAFGFRFALDAVEHMTTDFTMLAAAGFRFVRLDAQALFDGIAGADRFVPADEIYQRATLAGLTIIASGIESAKVQKRLLEAGIGLGQGALFGSPRQVMLGNPGRQNRSAAA